MSRRAVLLVLAGVSIARGAFAAPIVVGVDGRDGTAASSNKTCTLLKPTKVFHHGAFVELGTGARVVVTKAGPVFSDVDTPLGDARMANTLLATRCATPVDVPLVSSSSAPPPQWDRDRVEWPTGEVRGVLVFLHGISDDPMAEERAGMDAIARSANDRGLVAVFPVGPRVCRWLPDDIPRPKGMSQGTWGIDRLPSADLDRCWPLDRIDKNVAALRLLIDSVQAKAGVELRRREIIGFSNGGYLVASALQRGMLEEFERVGIVAGGPVGESNAPSLRLPAVFIEVGRDDRWSRDDSRRLTRLFGRERVHFREVAGDHIFDAAAADRFTSWFWAE